MRYSTEIIIRIYKRIFIIPFIVLLLSSTFFSIDIHAGEDRKRVLFISSYTENLEIVPPQIQGIQEKFRTRDIILDIEYMDMKRLNTQENINLFYTYLKYKLSNVEPYDAVIVGDDNALDFVQEHQDELFKGLPIVFLGVNDIDKGKIAAENKYITGIVEQMPIKENIELGLKFNPNATKVIAIFDDTSTGIGNKMQFYSNEKYFQGLEFDEINSTKYSFDEIAEMLEGINNDTILILINLYSDKNGKYLTLNQSAEFIVEHTKVPVYHVIDDGITEGFLGGKAFSFKESGRMAAQIILDVFDGTPIESMELVESSPSLYIFDNKLIEKYNIDKSLIPKDSIIINEKVDFLEKYRTAVLVFFLIVGILLTISIILIISNIKRRVILKKLSKRNAQLRLLNQKYQNSIYSTNSIVWEYNIKTRKIYFSDNINSIYNLNDYGYNNIEDILDKVLDKETSQMLINEVQKYRKKEKSEINIEVPVTVGVNIIKWINVQGKGIVNEKGDIFIIHGILKDNTRNKVQEQYIEHLAHYDYLTDLPNRGLFMKKLNEKMNIGEPLIIILMDIDNFKDINDTLGHAFGDIILRVISVRLLEFCEENIFVSRFGGDEFLMLISDNLDKVEEVIDELAVELSKPINLGETEYNIKFSLGITRYPQDSKDINQLLMNADTAMYNVKHSGKNNYLFFNSEMQKELIDRVEINSILAYAVQYDGFYLDYQPQIDAITGEIVNFEALLRLKYHNISPDVFIEIAEKSDLIISIGRWVSEAVIRQAAEWRDKGYENKIISLNLSSKQIRDKGYLDFLKNLLDKYSFDPNYLEIEITESIFLEETEYTNIFLNNLKKIGISIALDDFGNGFSSLNYLTYIPINKVKLDRMLCDKFLLLNNTVLDSLITLIHGLGVVLTAEGVEDYKSFEKLKNSGCDYMQGFLFSKPVSADEVEEIFYKIFI